MSVETPDRDNGTSRSLFVVSSRTLVRTDNFPLSSPSIEQGQRATFSFPSTPSNTPSSPPLCHRSSHFAPHLPTATPLDEALCRNPLLLLHHQHDIWYAFYFPTSICARANRLLVASAASQSPSSHAKHTFMLRRRSLALPPTLVSKSEPTSDVKSTGSARNMRNEQVRREVRRRKAELAGFTAWQESGTWRP